MYLWTNYLRISYKHILVHLGCHSITKTKQGPTYSELQELLALSEVASKKNIYTVQINETEHDREKIYVPAVQYKGRRLIHIFSSDLQP